MGPYIAAGIDNNTDSNYSLSTQMSSVAVVALHYQTSPSLQRLKKFT